MKLPIYQLDAFASRVFAGNPAVVCCLPQWLDDSQLLAIAREHNISTVAFLLARGDEYEIRYFTPMGEVPLVGHASLAAAHVVLRLLSPDRSAVTLRRRTGTLQLSKLPGNLLAIRLPASAAVRCAPPAGLPEALGVDCADVRRTDSQYFVFLESQATVENASPDMDGLMRLDRDAVIVTAPGEDCDFVSRAFAPKEGLPEDPVCGSAHLALVPYWSERLKRTEHRALQLSARGGELHCALIDGDVRLAGQCALYMEGVISV